MINILGNASDQWWEYGYEDKTVYLMINSCGFQKFITRDFTIQRSQGRVDYQLIYIIKGQGYYHLDHEIRTVPAGSLIYFQPGQKQHYFYACSDQTELYWIHITGYGVTELICPLLPDQIRIRQIGLDSRYSSRFDMIIKELQVKRQAFQQHSSAYFMLLLAEVCRDQFNRENKINIQQNHDLDKIIHMMHLNYSHKLTVQQLAQSANLSLFRFIHKFKESIGVTPVEYLTRIRINTACDLLSSTLMPIKEVAGLVGYSNPLYFSRVFRQATGSSPSQYRSNIKEISSSD